ncbi:MAG: alpha/beta hydrolase-fold protein [Pirellulaceae bacterium]
MKHLPRTVLFVFGAVLLVGEAHAAGISPEVHQDGRVTFRVRAPKADKVLLLGDWLKRADELPMTKGDDGVWTSTAGPFPPGNHIYGFEIDGVQTPDPENASVKLRASRSGSYFHIPGEALWEPRDVPHGNVDINFHHSKTLGDTRWFSVYTPPGYEKHTDKRYPVLYLLHGSNDTPIGWVMIGAANFIMDNLIADGDAREFIVVMPFGHAVPHGSPPELQRTNNQKFEAYLLDDVLPLVESKYRVLTTPRDRAIAGLSMGGGQAIAIGLNNLDRFSTIGSFSGAVPSGAPERIGEILSDAKSVNDALNLFWIGCGRDDFLLDRNVAFAKLLKDKGVDHEFHLTDGVHNYHVWRQYFATLAPKLFRETATPARNRPRP